MRNIEANSSEIKRPVVLLTALELPVPSQYRDYTGAKKRRKIQEHNQ
jgi:hypothetical protein